MTHKQVRRFSIDGTIASDKDIPRMREEYERLLRQQMRDLGYVQLLDVDSAFSLHYDIDRDTYDFVCTMHGVYYGKEAQRIDVIYEGRELYS